MSDRYVGKPLDRIEDLRFLTGRGSYVDDQHPQGLLHAAIFRSPVAHGVIRSVDVSAARGMPGVRAVITADDIGAVPKIPLRMEPNPDLARFEQTVIAQGKVRYVGEPIALVVADSAAIAEDAVGAIVADIESLPAVTTRTGSEAGDVLLFEQHGTNVAMTLTAIKGNADAAFRDADYVRRERLTSHRHTAVPMETRGLLAEWDASAGRLRLSGLMKVPFAIRTLLAKLMQISEDAIDAIESDCGSGFGMRGEFYPEDFLVPYAARLLERPVKWIEDRREHLTAITHAREAECELEIACRGDGTIVGLRGRAWSDMGAYIRPNGVTAPRNLCQMIAGGYRIPNVQMQVSMVLSNKTPSGSYRGPGRFEADFFRERLFDLAAADLGIDRVEFRRRNLVTQREMPYPFAKVMPYGTGGETDSGDYHETFERALDEIGWKDKSKLSGKLVDGRYQGLSIGCYIEGGAMGPRENARIALEPDGQVAVYVGSSSVGQGLETIFAQIAAEALEIPLARIRGVFHGSTGFVREGFGTAGSRSTVMGGCAVLDAVKNLKLAIRGAAAAQFGCAAEDVVLGDELRTVTADGRARSIAELAANGIEAEGTFENTKRTYSYGTHAAHVAVDPRTGHVEVLHYVSVEDAGRIINPMTLHGQVLGAIVQGLGASTLEHLVYDDEGQLLTGSLASYLVPTAEDFPKITAIALENHPSPHNPLGAKGAGEGGIIPVGGVIANAVADALGSLGVQPLDLPLTPPRVWRMIRDAQRK